MQVSEIFHSNLKSLNGICDGSRKLVFVSFLELQSFEILAVKSLKFLSKVLASWRVSDFTTHHPYLSLPLHVFLTKREIAFEVGTFSWLLLLGFVNNL